MKIHRSRPASLEEMWAYEEAHPVVFAAPRALAEARLIAELETLRGRKRRGAGVRKVQVMYKRKAASS